MKKNLELEPHKKFKRAFAWLSDDRDRMLLKIEAEIFVGSVWCELQSDGLPPVKPPKKQWGRRASESLERHE